MTTITLLLGILRRFNGRKTGSNPVNKQHLKLVGFSNFSAHHKGW
jgi:hypothetical protein